MVTAAPLILETEFFWEALAFVLTPENLALIVVVSLIGLLMGATPGVGTVLALAIAFPFTFVMDPARGLLVMAVLYGSATYGGAVSAILVNIPGTSGSTATLLDGYPMTQQGDGAKAVAMATVASFCGAMIGLTMLILLAPQLARLTLLFGSPEFFWLAVFGLTIVSVVTKGSLMKSMMAMCFGVVLATVGMDPIQATERFTFDTLFLQAGVNLVVLVVGVFAIAEALRLILQPQMSADVSDINLDIVSSTKEVVRDGVNVVRSALIGAGVGSIPGMGMTAANFMAYLIAVSSSKNPDSFGRGNPQGVVSAEASNNASAMGALVPAMAFGIPGGAAAAIFIGAMLTFGLAPGPEVFEGPLPFIIFISIFFGAIVFAAAGLFGAKYFARVTTLPQDAVLTGIVVLAFVGSFTVRNNILDVITCLVLGLLGYLMFAKGYSRISFVLGFILAPIAERGFQRSLLVSGGDYSIFLQSRISQVLFVLSAVMFFAPLILRIKRAGWPSQYSERKRF